MGGRKIAETNANGEVIQYAYNPAGDLTRLTDAKGNVTAWGHDAYGRVTSKTNAAGLEILRYQYDANGRLTNRWSLEKGNSGYAHDAAGNLTNIHYPSGQHIRFEYVANNRMTKMVDAVGTTIYTYTDFGALQSEDGPWDADTVSYTHTTNQLRSGLSLVQPNASPWEQSYGYDDSDRLETLTSPAGTFRYTYNPTSHLQVCKLSLPNGSYVTNECDGLARLAGTYLKNSIGSTLNSHQYVYDAGNRRTRQTRADGSFVDYGYDAIGQLTGAAAKELGGTTNRLHEQFGYAYDAAWNLNHRTNNALIQTFNVDNQNQLTTQTRSGTLTVAGTTTSAATNVTVNGQAASRYADHTFAKDGVTLTDGTNTFTASAQDNYGRQDSNTVSVYLPASVAFVYDGNGNLRTNGTRILDYDDENQLIRITEPGAWLSEFVYDGKMRRRIRREYTWQTDHWTLNTEVHYVYDGLLPLQERHFNPQLSSLIPQQTITYTRGRDLSGSLEGAGGIGGLLARTEHWKLITGDSSAHAYYHADGNGNITALLNDRQLHVARYLFDPYGNELAATGPLAGANLYRFSSKEWHPASGLVYYGYRLYAPSLQRWLNRDPLSDSGFSEVQSTAAQLIHRVIRYSKDPLHTELSSQVFLNNSPTCLIDPFGLSCFRECMDGEALAILNRSGTCTLVVGLCAGAGAGGCMVGCIFANAAYLPCALACLGTVSTATVAAMTVCAVDFFANAAGATIGCAWGCAGR